MSGMCRFYLVLSRFCVRPLCLALLLPAVHHAASGRALAAQVRESDIVISSQVGKVRTEAEGRQMESRAFVHSVDVKREAHTGDIKITGKAGGISTQSGGQNSSADSAVGGVSVGNR